MLRVDTTEEYVDEASVELERLRIENSSLKRLLGYTSRDAIPGREETNTRVNMLNQMTHNDGSEHLSIVVIGASGDLAQKKTYPAMLALFSANLLPPNIHIIGFARTELTLADFRCRIASYFANDKSMRVDAFLQRCTYFSGQYDSHMSFTQLDEFIARIECDGECSVKNRLFYFAIPPSLFLPVAKNIKSSASSSSGWTRLVVEKPFGHDTTSAARLGQQLLAYFNEDQIYRIDHYLGKEMVQNLMALRFANSIFEPLWNHKHIELITITFKEDIGTQGRGGYFDKSGIIRDIMQNHLTQILSLIAMEPPVSRNAEDIRDEKVKVLRCIDPVTMNRVVVGQYVSDKSGINPGYLDDAGVPNDSTTPTYAMATLFVKNQRWDGVPFVLKCGKALNERKAEIRIQFKRLPGAMYAGVAPNELVLRVQPKEAIYLKFLAKKPGLTEQLSITELDLTYHSRFGGEKLPDAYERLILDVTRGDHNLFVRNDELLAAWSIFTPMLHQLASGAVKPIKYEFGTRGPAQADIMSKKLGFMRTPTYSYPSSL